MRALMLLFVVGVQVVYVCVRLVFVLLSCVRLLSVLLFWRACASFEREHHVSRFAARRGQSECIFVLRVCVREGARETEREKQRVCLVVVLLSTGKCVVWMILLSDDIYTIMDRILDGLSSLP